jgi:hypothetical protein
MYDLTLDDFPPDRLADIVGLDHSVGHFQLPSLRHGSLRWRGKPCHDLVYILGAFSRL